MTIDEMTEPLSAETFSDAELADTRAWLDSKPRDVESLAQRLLATIDALTEERDRLRAALEFYADPDTYKATPSGSQNSWGNYEVIDYPIGDDKGEIARAALEGRE